MVRKTIKYTDLFTDVEKEDDFYFNLTTAEVAKLGFSKTNDMQEMIRVVALKEDGKLIIDILEATILMAYGERSEDGKKFMKSEAIRNSFIGTDAYSKLFEELVQNPAAAEEFFSGILPKK